MSSIHLSKQSCWSYHYVLGAAGFNSGSRPHRDNDVCFVCSVNPPFNTPHAPFNRVLLSSVLTTSSPQPFRSSLNLFLWITERVLFPPPPLHSTEVAGRNYCLFKYKLKCWPPHGMGVPVAAGRPQRKQSAAVLACSSFLSNRVQREAMLYVRRPKLPFTPHGFHTYEAEYERKTTVTSSMVYLVADARLHSHYSGIQPLFN